MIQKFEDLNVWREGIELSKSIYGALEASKDFGFRDQIRRASISIPSNIAEGFDRQSNKEFIQFLFIAKGSCAEVRTQLYLAKEIGIIPIHKTEELIEQSRKISSMLAKLIQTRKQKFI